MSNWRRALIAAGATGLVAVSFSTPPAQAATKPSQSKIASDMKELRGDMYEATEDQMKLVNEMNALEKRRNEIDGQRADLQKQIQITVTKLNDANARIAELEGQIARAQSQIDEANRLLAENEKKLQDELIDAYVGTSRNTDISAILTQRDSIRAISATETYREGIVDNRKTISENQRELEGIARDKKKEIESVYAAVQQERDAIALAQLDLDSRKAMADTLANQAAAQAAEQDKLMGEITAKRESIQKELDLLQAQSDAIASMLRGTGGSVGGGSRGAPAPSNGRLASPLQGFYMSSPFGMRMHPILGRYVLHTGQDYGAPSGTPIRAADSGKVLAVLSTAQSGGYGNFTCIDHGNGLASCYAHQSAVMVSVGDQVSRGQIIGLVGSTGRSTGPHLHFEVRVNGSPVNPAAYL